MICPGFWQAQCAAIRGAKARTGFPAPKARAEPEEAAMRRVFIRNSVQSLGHREVKAEPARKAASAISKARADKLAAEVRAAREALGMTMLQLASRCYMSAQTIYNIEHCKPVSDYSARKVAAVIAEIMEAGGLEPNLTTLIKSTEYN